MGEDASLDDFLDASDESEEAESAVGADDGEAAADGVSDSETEADESSDAGAASASESADRRAVEPAMTTYAWSPDGAACADCGEVVERRWEQDGQLVCGACKSW